MTLICANCQTPYPVPSDFRWQPGRFQLIAMGVDYNTTHDICSPSCLCEFAWEKRAAEPKLSKSR